MSEAATILLVDDEARVLDSLEALRTIGSDRRRELIVVGRPMIAAARIQRMTRLFDAHIIASEETFAEVRGRVQHRELGTPRLKGIKQLAALYEILARGQTVSVGTPA